MSTQPAAEIVNEEFFILGLTTDGNIFRPSDWAERLCGVMACFRPPQASRVPAYSHYSPYVQPTTFNGNKAVLVSKNLKKLEPMAYQFLIDFAKDNQLQIVKPNIESSKSEVTF